MIRPVVRQPRSERITQVRRRGGAVPSEVAMASGFLIVFMRALVTVPVLAGELSCAAHCVAARYVARRDGSPTDVRNARTSALKCVAASMLRMWTQPGITTSFDTRIA